MLSKCINPECRTPFHYLRTGRIVRTVHQEGASLTIKHFWLCGECSMIYEFYLRSDEPATAICYERGKDGSRFVSAERGPDGISAEHFASHKLWFTKKLYTTICDPTGQLLNTRTRH